MVNVNFVDVLFPEDIAYGATGGPEFYTSITTTASGKEYRNINWVESRNRYNVSHGVKTYQQMQALLSFFYARRGKAIGFRFRDWSDYRAEKQFLGRGNGVAKTFSLIKYYKSGDVTYIRKITKPIPDGVEIFFGRDVVAKDQFNVDVSSGIVNFVNPPPDNTDVLATFSFDIPVRFDNDRLVASIDQNGNYNWKDISLIELKYEK